MVKRGLAMLVPLLSTGVAVVGTAGPAAAGTGPWRIWPQSDPSLCLQSGGASGRDITVQPCSGNAAQRFFFRDSPDGATWQLITDNWGLCTNIKGAVYANNTHVISYKCGAGPNDQWYPEIWTTTAPNYYSIMDKAGPTMGWNVSGSVTKAGAPLVIYDFKPSYKNSLFSWRAF